MLRCYMLCYMPHHSMFVLLLLSSTCEIYSMFIIILQGYIYLAFLGFYQRFSIPKAEIESAALFSPSKILEPRSKLDRSLKSVLSLGTICNQINQSCCEQTPKKQPTEQNNFSYHPRYPMTLARVKGFSWPQG